MKHFREAFLALMLMVLPTVAVACDTLTNPASVGCSPDEATECRLTSAALIVKAANVTIGQQLDAGAVTVSEATRLRGLTKQAELAIDAAVSVAPLENATTLERVQAVNRILIQILREQVIRQGA